MREGFQQKFSDDVASTLGDFIAYLAQNGVVEPHVECHNLKTDFTKDEEGQVTGCNVSITNVEPCTLKVMKRAANVNAEYGNLGSSLVLGADAASWDLATRKHSGGYMAIVDRMVYDESPNIGGLAPLKYGIRPSASRRTRCVSWPRAVPSVRCSRGVPSPPESSVL